MQMRIEILKIKKMKAEICSSTTRQFPWRASERLLKVNGSVLRLKMARGVPQQRTSSSSNPFQLKITTSGGIPPDVVIFCEFIDGWEVAVQH